MPRKTIDLPYQVQYLSILDEGGNVDEELESNIPDDQWPPTLCPVVNSFYVGSAERVKTGSDS